MPPAATDLLTPTILVVDDEQQIHSSLRLRLGETYRLTCVSSASEAFPLVERRDLDLCIVDVQMPGMDGLTFIEEARKLDPCLSFLILSAFDSAENLRRAVPLNVLDFVPKPLPDRNQFERKIPNWVERTRQRRTEVQRVQQTDTVFKDLELARIERDIEMTASEAAREALFQTASLLTTSQALLLSAFQSFEPLSKQSPQLSGTQRALTESRKVLTQAASIVEGFFGSAYADRTSSRAQVDVCLRHAIGIALRSGHAEERQIAIDYHPAPKELVCQSLTGIDFLLTLVPLLSQVAAVATAKTTIRVQVEFLPRLDHIYSQVNSSNYLWVNRRNALASSPTLAVFIRATAPFLDETEITSWVRSEPTFQLLLPSRGIIHGLQKAKGVMGIHSQRNMERFDAAIALPI